MGVWDNRRSGQFNFNLSPQRPAEVVEQQGLGDPDFSISRAPTNSQFPEAAAYERLDSNKQRADKVASAFEQLGVKVPESVRAAQQQGFEPEEPGFFENIVGAIAGNPVGRGVLQGLNVLGGIPRLVQTAAKEITSEVQGNPQGYGNIGLSDVWDIFWGDPEKMQEITLRTGIDPTNGSQLLAMWGWKEADEGDVIGKTSRFAAHALMEIVTDPLSYVSLGAGGVGRKVLGESADAAVQKVVREAINETGDSLAHRAVRQRIDMAQESIFKAVRQGDDEAIEEVARSVNMSVPDFKQLVDESAGGQFAKAEIIAEAVEQRVLGDVLGSTRPLRPGLVMHELRDEVVTPVLQKDFANIPEEWLEHLPAYAKGGIRIIRPWTFTKAGLEKGWQIPGTAGSGRRLWESTGKKFTKRLREAASPLGNSTTWDDVIGALEKNVDYYKPLIKGVKDGKISGGEYILFQDAIQHGVVGTQLEVLTGKLSVTEADLYNTFNSWVDEAGSLDDAFASALPKAGFSGEAAADALKQRQSSFTRSLYDFIVNETEELTVAGKSVPKTSKFYKDVVEFRDYARNVLDTYNTEIKKIIPEYTEGIERYLPMSIDVAQRDFLVALANKVPSLGNELAKVGPEGATDYFIGHLLNSVAAGGVAEASVGSSAYLAARTMPNSPIVGMADGTPLQFVSRDIVENLSTLMEGAKPGQFTSSEINDLIEAKLKDLAIKNNVPLPRSGNARIFNEDPFELVNAYAHSMETTLRQRNAIEAMKEFGIVQSVDSKIAVQNTLNEITRRLQTDSFAKKVKQIAARKERIVEEADADPLAKLDEKTIANAADHIRLSMTRYDDDGWASKIYDRPLSTEERLARVGSSHTTGEVVLYRGYKPTGRFSNDPLVDLRAAREGEPVRADLPPPSWEPSEYDWMVSYDALPDGRYRGVFENPETGSQSVRIFKDGAEFDQFTYDLAVQRGDFQPAVQVPYGAVDTGDISAAGAFASSPGNRLAEIRLKKGSSIGPVIGDYDANLIRIAYRRAVANGTAFDDEAIWRSVWDEVVGTEGLSVTDPSTRFESFDDFYAYSIHDAIPYQNAAEGVGDLSYVLLNPDAVDSYIPDVKGQAIAYYNPATSEWSRAMPEGSGGFEFFPVDIDVANQRYRLKMPPGYFESLPDAEKAIIQREMLRFMRARNARKYMIESGSELVHQGDAVREVTTISDATAVSDIGETMQRIERGMDLNEELLARHEEIGRIARIFRKRKKSVNRWYDPNDKKMNQIFEHIDLDGKNSPTVEIYYNPDTKQLRASQALDSARAQAFPENETWNIVASIRLGQYEDAARVYYPYDFIEKFRGTGILADVDDAARWAAKRRGLRHFLRADEGTVGYSGASSLPKNSIPGTELPNYIYEDLHGFQDWGKVSDVDVYAAAQAEIRNATDIGKSSLKGYIGSAINDYGSEFVAEARKTTKEILEAEKRHGEFMKTVQSLLEYGRGPNGEILPETAFLADFDDPIAQLLEQARKQAKALGVDPETFEAVHTAVANQTYAFVHPVTGEKIVRNLVNPRLFGLGGPALEGQVISTEIAEWFANVTANAMNIYTPVGFAAFKTNLQRVTSWWKGSATVTRPTFHIRNLMGGVWNNQIVGVGPGDYLKVRNGAIKIRKAMNKGLNIEEAIDALPSDQSKMFRAALDEGVFGNSFALTEIRGVKINNSTKARKLAQSVNPFSQQNKFIEVGGNVMQTVEDFLRMSAFAAWFDPNNPASAKVAREMTLAVHFDYKNLTKFETKVKQFVPFFVWMRRNIPLQLQTLVERPGLMTRYAHLMEAADANFGDPNSPGQDLPTSPYDTAFAADTGIVLNEGTPFWARIMLDPDVPPVDLFETFDSLNPLEIISHFGEGLHPIYTSFMDFEAQKDYGDVNAPAPINVVLTQLARAGFYDISQDGDAQIPYFMRTLYNATIPWASEYQDLVAGAGSNEPSRQADLGIATADDPDNQLANALTAIGLTLGRGVGLTAQTPRDTAGVAFKTSEEISRVVNDAFQNIPGFAELYENS